MRLECVAKVPSVATSEKVGLVLLNHGGSTVRQDTGREAQYYANRFGLLTLAANRPTSYRLPRDRTLRQLLDISGVEAMKPLAEKLQATAADYGGVETFILAGRSAAGLGVLELASTKEMPVQRIYAAEPVACHEHNRKDGLPYYRRYERAEKKLWLPSHPDFNSWINNTQYLPVSTKISRAMSIIASLRTDAYYNVNRWCHPLTLELVRGLAESDDTRNITTRIEFAETSLTAPDESTIAQFRQLETQYPERLSVGIVPDSYHCAFDRRTVFAGRLQPVVSAALAAV